MKKILVVTADTNDGDYVTKNAEITGEQLEKIKLVIEAIKNFKPYTTNTDEGRLSWTHRSNFPTQDCYREDLGELSAFDYYVGKELVSEENFRLFEEEFVPYNEHGVHTITEIKLLVITDETKLL